MNQARAERLFAAARVATLATVTAAAQPHLVPVTFVVDGARLWTAVDGKRKSTHRLQRHRNIDRNPRVSLLAQTWEEDWSALWWVRVDGRAHVNEDPAIIERALRLLREKYAQYRDIWIGPPVIEVAIQSWHGWHA